MNRTLKPAFLSAAMLLAGCQAVNTTSSGALGVERQQYMFSLLPAEQVNQQYAQSYQQTLNEASDKKALITDSKDARRLQTIGKRLIAEVPAFRPDAAQWDWQISLVKNDQLNANCGPGGKIIFYTGIIERLKLTDDEIAAVMGHEIAHALREHSREAMTKAYGVKMAGLAAQLAGIDSSTLNVANTSVKYLMTLPNSRTNENEADLIGLELAARGGYNPNAAVSLWQKMSQANAGAPPEFMSTHPSSESRIATLQEAAPKVMQLYQQKRGSLRAAR